MKDELLKYVPLFAGLTDSERSSISDSFLEGQLQSNSALFRAGDAADAVYLISQGFVRMATQAGQMLATLGPGSVLGDASMLKAAPHEVTAVAVSDLSFWKLTDRKLRELVMQQPNIGVKLSQNFGGMVAQMEDYLTQRLGRTTELSSLPVNTLQAVAAQLRPRLLQANQALFRIGDSSSGLYVVESGAFDVRGDGGPSEEPQRVAGGAILGALALLTNKPYTQSAVASEESLVWALSADNFHSINSRHPGLRRSLARTVRSRLGRTDQAQATMRLAQMPLFAETPQHVLQAIAQRMVLQHVPAGDRVYRVGESGEALFVVENGEIELTAENAMGVIEEKARIAANQVFGEMSVLTGQIRTEDATATRNTNLWILYKSDLDAIGAQNPALGKALSQAVASRLAASDVGSVDESRFRSFQLLSGLSGTELRQIAEYLRPTRYRAGEQIFRISAPGDSLYLIEKGQVRIQPMSGGAWLLGPGEEFGERSLLTNQPHNATAIAESDVDVWMLRKADFSMLMTRYPNLAINMSRILSQRMGQTQPEAEPAYNAPFVAQQPANAANPVAPSPVARRRQVAAAANSPSPQPRSGFGDWLGNLSTFGKIRLALLVIILVWLLGVAVPWAILRLLDLAQSSGVQTAMAPPRALQAIYAMGSFELAAQDEQLAQQVALADKQVPPTPTYTPFPTNTPVAAAAPASTPVPAAPVAMAMPEPVLLHLDAPEPVAVQADVFAQEPPTPAPALVQAAAVASRNLDPRLDQLGVTIEDAQVAPGQQYWRLIEVRWEDEQQAGGKHHIYVDTIDENGARIVGQSVTVYWGDGNYTGGVEDKPAPEFGFNYMMYAAGYAYNVRVEGLPSDVLHGAGMGDIASRFRGIHVAYYLLFQKATK